MLIVNNSVWDWKDTWNEVGTRQEEVFGPMEGLWGTYMVNEKKMNYYIKARGEDPKNRLP